MSGVASGTRSRRRTSTPPDAPTGIDATGQQNGILVTGPPTPRPTSPATASSARPRSTAPTRCSPPASSSSGTTFVDTIAPTSTTYYYRVVAVDNAGNASPQSSAAASATRPFPDPIRINAAGQTFIDVSGPHLERRQRLRRRHRVDRRLRRARHDRRPALLHAPLRQLQLQPRAARRRVQGQPALRRPGPTRPPANASSTSSPKNKQILDDFDIAKNGGGKTAISRTFNVNVTGGELNLRFANVLDNAILSAIEILPDRRHRRPVDPAAARRPRARRTASSLDWNDNAESDLAGYNVYRSSRRRRARTRSSTASLLTTSEFLDATAPSGRDVVLPHHGGGRVGQRVVAGVAQRHPPGRHDAARGAGGLDRDRLAARHRARLERQRRGRPRPATTSTGRTPRRGQFFKLNAAPADDFDLQRRRGRRRRDEQLPRQRGRRRAATSPAFAETSADRPPAPTAGTGLKGEYFDNTNFTSLKLTRDRRGDQLRLVHRLAGRVDGRRHVLRPLDGPDPGAGHRQLHVHAPRRRRRAACGSTACS